LFIVLNGDLLPLAALSLVDVRAIPMDVSNDARVLEVGKGIVDEGAGSVGRMENVVVRIFRTRTVKVGGGERSCVKREGINDTAFIAGPHESGFIAYWLVGDILGHLGLAKLVNKDEQIVPKVSSVKLFPSFTRMVSVSGEGEGVVARARDRDGTSSKAMMDNRGRGASEWLFFVHVAKKDVSEGGDVEEMEDVMVLLDVDIEGLVLEPLVGKHCDGREETIGPGIKSFGQK
jgi:hypothetical protein